MNKDERYEELKQDLLRKGVTGKDLEKALKEAAKMLGL